jgi:hypothetical protein
VLRAVAVVHPDLVAELLPGERAQKIFALMDKTANAGRFKARSFAEASFHPEPIFGSELNTLRQRTRKRFA